MPNQTPPNPTCRNRPAKNSKPAYATRPQRRKAVREIIQNLEAILMAEKRYIENAPLNLQISFQYEEAEQTAGALEEALDILMDVF
jgi:hypothetical protein